VWEAGELENTIWHEQSTMHHVLGCGNVSSLENWIHSERSHVAHLDAAWNSIPGVATAPDPIINHYAGIEESMRLRLMEIDCETLPERENAPSQVRSLFSRQLNAYVKEVREELTAMRGELTGNAQFAVVVDNTAAACGTSPCESITVRQSFRKPALAPRQAGRRGCGVRCRRE
jgi:hypothetical protein